MRERVKQIPLPVGDRVAQRLAGVVRDAHVQTTAVELKACSRDATPVFRSTPDVVVHPASTEKGRNRTGLSKSQILATQGFIKFVRQKDGPSSVST